MTTRAATEQVKRPRGRPPTRLITIEEDWHAYGLERLSAATTIRFPSSRYRQDPVSFAREILGVEPWSKQVELLEAVRDHDRVACKSGRRVSKSHSAGVVALWWYCSFPDARAVLSSTTARQVDAILWRELGMLRARSGRCLACKTKIDELEASGVARAAAEKLYPRPCLHSAIIDGDIGMRAHTGLKSTDDSFREIWGFTASQAEAVQGIAGSRLLFILDEASGIPQPIYDAIEGNRAGGAKVLLLGNPTKNEGEFFDAFHSKNAAQRRDTDGVGYHCITVSSEDSPNVREGRVVYPGLATPEFIREREIEWGRDSSMFKVHVLGEFATHEEGKIFSVHAIGQAEERWHETPESGRLFIGLDPAGETGSGDDSVFCVRRGMKVIEIVEMRGLNDEQHLTHAIMLMDKHKLKREVPVLVLDREGSIGSSLSGRIRSFLESRESAPPFELVAVRSSDRAVRNPQVWDRMRDELCANLEQWFRDGGAIPEDVRLSAELHCMRWRTSQSGRAKVTPKDAIRKELGRSPDRYDALALACWEPLSLMDDVVPDSVKALSKGRDGVRRPSDDDDDLTGGALDPYAGAYQWSKRR